MADRLTAEYVVLGEEIRAGTYRTFARARARACTCKIYAYSELNGPGGGGGGGREPVHFLDGVSTHLKQKDNAVELIMCSATEGGGCYRRITNLSAINYRDLS